MHAVAAGEHAVHADAEQDGGEEEELVEQHRSLTPSGRGRWRRSSAASRSTETTSNGMQVGREDRVADRAGVGRRAGRRAACRRRSASISDVAEHAEQDQRGDRRRPASCRACELLLAPDRRPGEHDAEQEQHDDGADVDEHLGDGDELGAEQDELRGRRRRARARGRARRARRCWS